MLLRSCSTPVLGSLETPNNHHHHQQYDLTPNHTHNSIKNHNYGKLFYTHIGSHIVTKISFSSNFPSNGFPRSQSEGNLEGLGNASNEIDEFSFTNPPKKFLRKPRHSQLQTIPSFSFYNSRNFSDDDQEDSDEEEDEEEDDYIDYISSQCSSSHNGVKEDMSYVSQFTKLKVVKGREKMYLARGLGVADIVSVNDGGGSRGGCGGGYTPVAFDRNTGGDSHGVHMEEHYKKMLEENPNNPLFMRNYAQFLYQTKKDLKGAEEYYSRAILVDPGDGEILAQYGKLVWELHHDIQRATSYFERAVHATSADSSAHAAYASFLWEIEDDQNHDTQFSELMSTGTMASATAYLEKLEANVLHPYWVRKREGVDQ